MGSRNSSIESWMYGGDPTPSRCTSRYESLTPERAGGLDEKETTHAARGHSEAARGGSGPQPGRDGRSGMPEVGDQRADVSSLAASLRGDERAGDGADERTGKRKCAVEEDRGAAGHGHRRAEGS